jgi:rod shape determining protein RodA
LIDRKLLKNLDWMLWLTMLLISLFAVVVIRSAGATAIPGNPAYYAKRQVLFVLVGNAMIAVSLLFDYRLVLKFTKPIYLVTLGLLLAVLVAGSTGGGAQRWINVFGFILQPSEFAKVFIIIVLAHYLEQQGVANSLKDLIWVGALVGLPMVLILIQPDLGTSLVFIAIFLGMLFGAGIQIRYLLGIIGAGIAALPVMWMYVLEGYQKLRLLAFLNPEAPAYWDHGGYQVLQSLIAIGSGRLFGQGYLQGTQNTRNFLPEKRTDFIFSVIGEEFGFIGSLLLILAFLFMMQRILAIALDAKDVFGRLVSVGVLVLLLFQIFVNIGMALGMMPVTGIPLPFVTAGGSSYLAFSIAMALVLNIGMRRQKILF